MYRLFNFNVYFEFFSKEASFERSGVRILEPILEHRGSFWDDVILAKNMNKRKKKCNYT